ncbi:Oidioi.mRNA.OKI2018_I69.XSR.g15493.t1.cds [Oikopleura dioica]|uniref:Oidioi.mRNA.OKI2018_I69.XSR.g15493.t1.cds n=1 Tax=Oikopleura dioica TaxID=34765 RepID=A0ABN7SEX9_OIKDI|nr:Oidioi.mRNA.OKI2018_I69.XSR.g15493.t1.cds [Oikopleura dioica]
MADFNLIDASFQRTIKHRSEDAQTACQWLDTLAGLTRHVDGAKGPLGHLRCYLQRLGDDRLIQEHWEYARELAGAPEAIEDNEENAKSAITEGNTSKPEQKGMKTTSQGRKRKNEDELESIAEKKDEFRDVYQDDGTLKKPNLIYIARTNANGIRFYVKVNGSIRCMKYKNLKKDGSFLVYCCEPSCKTVHSLKVRDSDMGLYHGGGARIWKLAHKHPEIHNPAFYEVLEWNTTSHVCKELGNELDVLKQQPSTSTNVIKEITNNKHAREDTEKEAETEENLDKSTELPAKRARTSEHSETLPLPDTSTENSSRRLLRKSSGSIPSVESRLAKVDNNVPNLNESRCLLTGECASCRAVFESWEELIVHIEDDQHCKRYYVDENKNFCFICDRPFKVLRTHCHDVLKGQCYSTAINTAKGKVSYAGTTQEAHAAYSRIAFKNFHSKWDTVPESKNNMVDELPNSGVDQLANDGEMVQSQITETETENENDSMANQENMDEDPEVENIDDRSPSVTAMEDSFDKPPLDPPGLEDVPILFNNENSLFIKTEIPDLPISFAT